MTQEKSGSDIQIEPPSRASETESRVSVSRQATDTDLREDNEQAEEEHTSDEDTLKECLLPDTNIVTHCIYSNDPQRLKQCFEDDLYKDMVQEYLNQRDENGKSPLDLAAYMGRNQITRELLERGADVNNITGKGYSSLHYASAWGNLPVIKMLIEHGADLQQRNIHGERAREAAMRYGQNESVDYLDWAEAKWLLQEAIKQTMETISDVDKALAGRITKDEKNITINTCKEKQEWLDNTADATTQDFIGQRIAFNDVVTPILQKLTEPPPEKGSARPNSRSGSRPRSSSRPGSKSGARPKSGKSSASGGPRGPMFNPQKGKKKGK